MKTVLFFFAAIALFFSPLTAKAQTTILENFIGFSCNFSFDKTPLLDEIKSRHDTLILNCHTPDPVIDSDFAVEECDDKLRPYINRDITTGHMPPFSAINGRYLTSGAHKGIHHSGIALAAKENPLTPISFTLKNNVMNAALPAMEIGERPVDLWLYAYIFSKEATLALPQEDMTMLTREEHDMLPRATFINLVNHLENLGDWDGKPQSIAIPLNGFKADGFALIAQEKQGGPILAMGKIEPGLASQISQAQN